MEQHLRFNLLSVLKLTLKWKKQIIGFAVLVALITAVYAFLLKNEYTSYANFYPSNSGIGTRSNLFRVESMDNADQFGYENEVDHVFTISSSNSIITHLVNKFDFYKVYNIDTTNDTKGKQKVFQKFKKNFKITKGSYGNVELYMTDKDPTLASAVANEALVEIQDKLRGFYVGSSEGAATALKFRLKHIDSTLTILTDSLIKLREKYGVYDILSPSRKATVNVQSRSAAGIELVQNVEEIKDKYVIDRAKYESISNEFLTTTHKAIPYLQVIDYPTPSGSKAGPFRTIMVLSAFLVGLVVAILAIFVIEYLGTIKSEFNP
jgi:uncharacterized protein involved in exopolysaccharide biosynthesis